MNAHTVTEEQPRPSFRFSHRQSVALVFGCTVLGAAAQILMKSGANALTTVNLAALLTNLPLFAGYCLYGLSTVLLVLALRDGQLSILYPVISLTYVWVAILSVVIFGDAVNFFKVCGISIIVLGVAILGRDDKQ